MYKQTRLSIRRKPCYYSYIFSSSLITQSTQRIQKNNLLTFFSSGKGSRQKQSCTADSKKGTVL
ncbi:hypothetical protein CPT06_09925 [Bacillus vallismortis]|nr:hypothetical protein CPT06_09925 [Bacillus vallismortis]